MIEYLISFGLILLSFWAYNYYNNFLKHVQKFPGPPTHFLLGNALDLRVKHEVVYKFHEYTKKYGGFTLLRIGPEYLLIITDLKFLEFLLSGYKVLSKSLVYDFLYRWLGTGLLTSSGEKWKKHRRLIGPSFHLQVLERFIHCFNSQSNKLIEKLSQEEGKDSVDIYPYVTLHALDVICESSMGFKINAQDNPTSDYVYSVKEMCRIILERSVHPLKVLDTFYYLSKDYRKELKALKILHGVTNSVINKRRDELESSSELDEPEDDIGSKKKTAFLDLLLRSKVDGKTLNHDELRQEVDTFMFAGHDTTAAAMSFGLFNLAQYPEIQEKVFEEQTRIFGDDMLRPVTSRDLTEMKYLENVIKETLRLFPSVPFYARQITESFEYEGRVFPKGLSLLIMAYSVHRNPEQFPDPETFNPSRFEQPSHNPYAFIPFSAGPRNCIGQKFAMMEMKTMFSHMVRHYELLKSIPEHVLQVSAETVIKSLNGMKIKLRKRKY